MSIQREGLLGNWELLVIWNVVRNGSLWSKVVWERGYVSLIARFELEKGLKLFFMHLGQLVQAGGVFSFILFLQLCDQMSPNSNIIFICLGYTTWENNGLWQNYQRRPVPLKRKESTLEVDLVMAWAAMLTMHVSLQVTSLLTAPTASSIDRGAL